MHRIPILPLGRQRGHLDFEGQVYLVLGKPKLQGDLKSTIVKSSKPHRNLKALIVCRKNAERKIKICLFNFC